MSTKEKSVLELLSGLRRSLAENQELHTRALRRSQEALATLDQVERRLGVSSKAQEVATPVVVPSPAPRPKQGAKKAKAKKHSNKSPIVKLIDQKPPAHKQPLGKPAATMGKTGIGGFTSTGPKAGGSTTHSKTKAQLSPIETRVLRALAVGKVVSVQDLVSTKGLNRSRVYQGVYRLRQKGYDIALRDEGYLLKK